MMRTSGLAVLCLWLVPSLLLGGNEPKASGVEAIQAKHDRALVKDLLAYVAVDPTADDSESAYQTIFNKIISHDWFTEHETFANRYLLDHPEGPVRPLARIVATMARAEAGSYDEALTSFNALLSGLNTADQVEFASNFAENLANSATSAGEFATARKVYASLLKKFGDESPSLSQKVGEALAKLDRIGKPAPTVEVTDIEGKPFKFADLKGKYILVDFWATWCAPCLAEQPRLRSALTEYKAKGFEIVAVSLDETKPALLDYLKSKPTPWRQIHNSTGASDLVAEFGVTTIPATFLIDPAGNIVRLELRGEALDRALAKLFGTAKSAASPAQQH